LEVCPTSNVQTDISTTLADHPIERLREAGVALGVNTDGRTLSDVDLTGEYGRLQGAFGWGPEELLAANLSAIGAAFAPTEVKARVADRLRAAYAAAAGKAAVASEAADSAAAGGNP
jgi:adenosine deaminase